MIRNRGLAVLLAIATSLMISADAKAQCLAPREWFPHLTTPEPDFHAPSRNCEFHQWGWQTFLWLTQPTGNGRIRLLDLPVADELFMPGKSPVTLNLAATERFKQQPLILTPRVRKSSDPTKFGEIRQAGLRGVLVDQNNQPVYYASHVNPTFYQFVRTNRLFEKSKYIAASPTQNFPVKSLELKSSWRIVAQGENTDSVFTTRALIHPIVCRNGAMSCSGEDVVVDRTRVEPVTVALVGVHVVGVVEDHPEFIWSTFEHKDNAPDLPSTVPASSPNPVSDRRWTFYRQNTPAKDCNLSNGGNVSFDLTTRKVSPITDVFRQFAFGGGGAGDEADVRSLNQSVHAQLGIGSVWSNYFLVGGVWFGRVNGLEPALSGPQIQQRTVGSVRVSNSTMETFTQQRSKNCFACHNTAADGDLGIPAMNMNLSHILKDGLIQREELRTKKVALLSMKDAPAISSYAEVQTLMNNFVRINSVPISFAPHGAFWNRLSYDEFTTGNIPGVSDPATGQPLKVLKINKSAESNFIMSLRGTAGSIFDPQNGSIGRMPPSGPFMDDADINRLANWIDRGCPNGR